MMSRSLRHASESWSCITFCSVMSSTKPSMNSGPAVLPAPPESGPLTSRALTSPQYSEPSRRFRRSSMRSTRPVVRSAPTKRRRSSGLAYIWLGMSVTRASIELRVDVFVASVRRHAEDAHRRAGEDGVVLLAGVVQIARVVRAARVTGKTRRARRCRRDGRQGLPPVAGFGLSGASGPAASQEQPGQQAERKPGGKAEQQRGCGPDRGPGGDAFTGGQRGAGRGGGQQRRGKQAWRGRENRQAERAERVPRAVDAAGAVGGMVARGGYMVRRKNAGTAARAGGGRTRGRVR